MITCPECAYQSPDGAKFCDRCGQGLTATAPPARLLSTRPTPLAPGTLIRGYEIVELIAQDSVENRYRAVRKSEAKEERVTLRERIAQVRRAQRRKSRRRRRGSEARSGVSRAGQSSILMRKPPS